MNPEELNIIETEILKWDKFKPLENGWVKYQKEFWDKVAKKLSCDPFLLSLKYFKYTRELC